jgi:hypothetical protein
MLFLCIECKTSTVYKHKHNIVLECIYLMVNFMLLIFKPNHYFEIKYIDYMYIELNFNMLQLCNLLQDFKNVLQEMFKNTITFKI